MADSFKDKLRELLEADDEGGSGGRDDGDDLIQFRGPFARKLMSTLLGVDEEGKSGGGDDGKTEDDGDAGSGDDDAPKRGKGYFKS